MPWACPPLHVGNRIVLPSFCNNCRQGKTWYLSGRREIPQGRRKGAHGGPKRRPSQAGQSQNSPPPQDTSRACVWKDHLGMTQQKCTIGREGWVFKFPDQL